MNFIFSRDPTVYVDVRLFTVKQTKMQRLLYIYQSQILNI